MEPIGIRLSDRRFQAPPFLDQGIVGASAGQSFLPRAENANYPCFAALDLGTNNCRMMVANVLQSGGYRVTETFSRVVRLGEGLHRTGCLSDVSIDRALTALRMCAERLERKQPISVRAVATEACRRAANGLDFLHLVRDETGLDFEIISAREEVELAVESCSSFLGRFPDKSRALLIDIGGGSTEVAWVRLGWGNGRHQLIGYQSVPVGVVLLSEMFGNGPGSYEAMVSHVMKHLREFDAVHCIGREIAADQVCMVGTSGTVTTLAALDLALPRYIRSEVDGYILAAEAAEHATTLLRNMTQDELLDHPCIGEERAQYVLPGCAIFEAIQRFWKIPVTVADRGLRDGMLMRMIRGFSRSGPVAGGFRQRGG